MVSSCRIQDISTGRSPGSPFETPRDTCTGRGMWVPVREKTYT